MNENNITLELRIRFAIAKCRNLVYYWGIDDRERKQYLHVLRSYRKQLIEIINQLPDGNKYKELFLNIVRTIPPKVKTDQCGEVIENLKPFIVNYEQF